MGSLMVVLFFVSGATSLIGEVVWMRMLGLVLGNTVWAASAAVAVWMGGMAAGAAIGGRWSGRVRRHLRWYGLAEATIGLFYLLSPAIERLLLAAGAGLGDDLGASLAIGLGERLGLALLALAVPTVLMGLTLPLLVERLRGRGLAARVGVLYGANTLGAAGGVLLTAYLLLPALGERASLATAALACGLVAAMAIVAEGATPAAVSEVEAGGRRSGGARSYLALVAAMGLSALAAELVWVRILVLHLGSRVYAFALLLGVYLVGIAIGSLGLRARANRLADPVRALAAVQVAVAIVLAGQVLALGFAGDLLAAIAGALPLRAGFASLQVVMFLAVAALCLPVTILFGASFPLAVAADPVARGAGEQTGRVAAANTFGGIGGALLAPFVLAPAIGSQRTLLLLVGLHVAVALALRRRRTIVVAALVAASAVVAIWLGAPRDWALRRAGQVPGEPTDIVELDESLGATVLVKRYDEPGGSWLSLELNGVNVAGSDPALLVVQQLQGNLPLLQAPAARRVLHVGFGSGGTCWAVSRYPVEAIDVVEISPEVLAAATTYFAPINHRVVADPRVRVVINDGRNYLLATEATYDVILSDSIHPVFAGNSTLYTREYFELCRRHLRPGGVASMWLPLYSLDRGSYLRILSAFHKVFPRTAVWYDVSTVNEFTVVTGRVTPGPLELDWERLADPRVAPSLAIGGVRSPADVVADLLLGPDEVAALTDDVPALGDDLPYVEYRAGRLMARDRSWRANLLLLARARARSSPFAADPVDWTAASARRDRRLGEILAALDRRLAAERGRRGGPRSSP